ncbi:DUF421 domain-containing protein [Fodinisporobacter ferrooxydans]|uniref:DUF421 domain-containing protein n=1 Tax=Fodinisporobacter ferrooxydans TaxID=2901836 RepID=A0ABY4CU09_9BACL|nr:DUF421 domain-containing protein [Alicyclobacillaceae bacterium MYW30-H2]
MVFLHLFWKILLVYVFVLLGLRFMGKREIGKLSIFDLVISIMIAEVSAFSLEDKELALGKGLFIIGFLVILQIIMSFVSLKSQRIRDLIEGRPTVLIANGKINDREMKRTRYSMDDLMTQLREKNVMAVADVEFAILETSGKLSVFPKSGKRSVTVEDMNLTVAKTSLPIPLIIDGKVIHENLQKIEQTALWLNQEIQKQGYADVKKIFYCSIDNQGTLFIDPKDS